MSACSGSISSSDRRPADSLMADHPLPRHALVLYKGGAARVVELERKKLTIELEDRTRLSVRPKDVTLLHPGPLESLDDLLPVTGELVTAWELLSGQTTTLTEIAELAYGEFSPSAIWAAWQVLADGLYFSGEPTEVTAHTPEEVASEEAERAEKAAAARARSAFLARAEEGTYAAEDEPYLEEVAALAYGQTEQSRVLRTLGFSEEPETAHDFLLRIGYWDETINPYPQRAGLPVNAPQLELPPLPEETRRDLTYLTAYAIDDEGSRDPDDAISLDGDRIWVHIADVAALVPPDSPADLGARGRGANLYLPEGPVNMLPAQATATLGLGLAARSPALSFAFNLDENGAPVDLEIVPSWVKVTRLTYEQAEQSIDSDPLASLHELARRFEHRRHVSGAVQIDLPEVKIRVHEGQVDIRPLPSTRSRDLVREAMLMVGEAVSRYAQTHQLPLPFTTQEGPTEPLPQGDSLATMFARRLLMRPSQRSSVVGRHAGLGLNSYVQATSPLRRYLDLVVHQQLRAHLQGLTPLSDQALMQRVGAAEMVSGSVRRVERQSNEHWTLVYLRRRPSWQGTAVLVDQRGAHDLFIIPELALETRIYRHRDLPLNAEVELILNEVKLAERRAFFTLGET
ncbi:MAG: RNB domain-containing ribonuclease [Candidatus Promineifilaceae bacterium]|nr:RNB domain-containing ribonuclease [Candidatus Promineifilaceae bacterium]